MAVNHNENLPPKNDALFCHIASLYVQADGERIVAQWDEAAKSGTLPQPSPGFKDRVMAQARWQEVQVQRTRRRKVIT